jgi:stearoyl-CoA desaturase (Delta-9 desaturase)
VHGLDRHQIDPAAGLIRIFERLGWATDVHWPDHDRIESRRRTGLSEDARAPAER